MDQKRRSDYKPRPISILDSQGKPTSQTQQARAFAKYLRDSHWAEPATSRRHPPTGAGVTKPHHYCRAPSSSKTNGAQQSTRPRHPPRRSLAMARPTQPTGPRQSPQPISLLTATVPYDWHAATVVEIYKGKGPLTDPASYRPISLLSTSHKLFAKIIHNRLQAAIDDRLRDTQIGFRAARSTS